MAQSQSNPASTLKSVVAETQVSSNQASKGLEGTDIEVDRSEMKRRPKVLEVSKPLLLFFNMFRLLTFVILSGTLQKTASGCPNTARHAYP